ncbi:transporter substrate-binding domain-containing protein [Streptomyces taklimakanensis]|nr:transporter substrate-binding domain-containing protein [Streptomyces taklimakanensis]
MNAWRETRTRVTAALGALMLLATATACGEEAPTFLGRDRLNVAYKADQPGTSYWDGEKYGGFDQFIGAHVVDELGVKYAPRLLTSNMRETEITEGISDLVIATYSITETRAEDVAFVGPYAVTPQGYMVGPGNPDIDREEDLRDKRICTMGSTTAEESLVNRGLKKITMVTTASECVRLLLAGETDAFFMDKMILYGFQQNHPAEDLRVLPENAGQPQLYGIGLPKGHQEDCEQLKEIVKTYVRSSKWRADFEASLPDFTREHSNEVDQYRPNDTLVDKYSCVE